MVFREKSRRDVGRRLATGTVIAAGSLLAPPATFVLLNSFPQLNVVFESVDFHLAIMVLISALALKVAIAAAIAARRTAQGALVVLAVGCLAVAGFLLGHGLTTPGTLGRPMNLWVARFPVLAIAAFAACLAVAAMRPDGRLLGAAARRPNAILVVTGAVLALSLLVTVIWPAAGIGARPLPGEGTLRLALLGASGLALLVVGAVHWRRYRLSLEAMQLALVVASWQVAGAALLLELGDLWHLVWWDYHVFLVVGFGAAVYAVLRSARERSVDDVMGTVFVADPLAHIERGYSDAMRVLVGAVEARDHHTHGHSVRVAEWSVRVGQQLDLRPSQLRTLAEGAYLHDVGKIGVPDHVLNKPGALDDDEWEWIRQHPIVGVDIASRALSLRGSLDMIRYHHERHDGTGYPDRLAGADIPLLARIVAVADVWDALTSERAYRAAWPPDAALAHLVAGRGSHFDPDCLDAFTAVLERQGLHAERGGRAELAAEAATACHHQPESRGHTVETVPAHRGPAHPL